MSLLSVEMRRDSGAVDLNLLTSSDGVVRRVATRTVARLAPLGEESWVRLALVDEDPEVVAWAAYGIGARCGVASADANVLVRSLAIRSAHLGGLEATRLPTDFALARALGRCATEEAERSLVPWLELDEERARSAALALGDVASRRRGLAEATQSALVLAAAGRPNHAPIGEALYPLGRLDRVPPRIEGVLTETALHYLAEPAPTRIFALRALARFAGRGESEMLQVLAPDSTFDATERAEAIRTLERWGARGRDLIGRALQRLVPAVAHPPFSDLLTPWLGTLLTAIEPFVQHPESVARSSARAPLFALTQLTPPDGAPKALIRRMVRLRCTAAAALVEGGAEDPLLRACDPDSRGEVFELAQLRVLDRRPLSGGRHHLRWRELIGSTHGRVRAAALSLIAQHAEIADASDLLAGAIEGSDQDALLAATSVIAAHPERVLRVRSSHQNRAHLRTDELSPRLSSALSSALARSWPSNADAALVSVAEAAAAVGITAARNPLSTFCRSSQLWLRERAARALSWLPGAKVACNTGEAGPAPEELSHLLAGPVTVHLAFDLGEVSVRIDPTHAPLGATRFVDLVRSGAFEGTSIRRAVPGLLVQFGEQVLARRPVALETAPIKLEPLDVALAASEPDSTPPRFFVALSRQPQLDAEYSIVGRASGDLASLTEGDELQHAWIE